MKPTFSAVIVLIAAIATGAQYGQCQQPMTPRTGMYSPAPAGAYGYAVMPRYGYAPTGLAGFSQSAYIVPLPDASASGLMPVPVPGAEDAGSFLSEDSYQDCGPPLFWVEAEAMVLMSSSVYVPALVTTGPNTQTQAQAGVLGQSGTSILFGNDDTGDGVRVGGRIHFGIWRDECSVRAFAGNFMYITQKSESFSAASDVGGNPILARPFINANTGLQASQLVAYPGIVSGSVTASVTTDVIGGEFYSRQLIWEGFGNRLHMVGGYQFSRIEDGLTVQNSLVSLDAGFLGGIGVTLDAFDTFAVDNEFHGGTLGLLLDIDDGPFSWRFLGKVAFGNMRQAVHIRGQTTVVDVGGGTTITPGGLLAQPSNIGSFDQNEFAVIPEATFTFGCHLTDQIDLRFGYTFIYWSRVMRAADLVDTTVGLPQPAARPAVQFRSSDYWVQGLNASVEWRF